MVKRKINTILFSDFETLDVFGPIEIFGRLKEDFQLGFYSLNGGIIKSAQDVPIVTEPFSQMDARGGVLFVPGGIGTRILFHNHEYLKALRVYAEQSEFVFTVCTGSLLFAKTGLLDGRQATSNKRVFALTATEAPQVQWVKKARWIKDGNIYTSSGVSAGIDMTLGFVADLLGYEIAKQQSLEIEYDWKEDPQWDPFAEIY